MAAAAEFATVFLETSLGTRLVVSFPASDTTVADLKRQVSAEHAACFPQTGPISVKSLQVKYDGSLFHLTDSMAVEAAFRWTKGPWNLLVEARELGSRPLAREDSGGDSEQNSDNPVISLSTQNTSPSAVSHGGGNLAIGDGVSDAPLLNQLDEDHEGVEFDHSLAREDSRDDSEQNSDIPVVSKSTKNLSPPAVSHGDGNLAIGDGVSDSPLLNQLDENHQGVEQAPYQLEDENTVPQESSDDLYLAAGGTGIPPMDQQDRSLEGAAKHALGQQKDGIVKTMLQECSDLHLAAGGSDNAVDLQDKSCEGVIHASVQLEDGTVKTMLHESSNLNFAAGKSDPRAKNQLDKSYEHVEHAFSLCRDGNVMTMLQGSSSLDVMAGEGETPSMNKQDKSYEGIKHASGQHKNRNEKSSRIEQENLNNNPLVYNQGNCSHGMREKPSFDRKEPWTSEVCNGESSNSVSDIPPCVQFMDRGNSSNREVNASDEEEPWVAGLCSGESSFKETDVPHCIKSMKEGNQRPASNDLFLKKRKYEGATATINTEHESCFKRRQQRILCVRKVPMSKAAKIFGVRC